MPVGKISFNIHAQGVKDTPYLKSVLRDIDPAAVLVMDGLGLLLELKSILPNTICIDRRYPDVDVNSTSPEAWLDEKAARVGNTGVWSYTTNEPGLGKDVIDWHVRLIKANAKRHFPINIVGVNLGVGQPESWEDAKELLQLADQYRSWFILGLHEYAAVVPTSGFIGGNPEERKLALASQWPRGYELEKIKPPHSGMYHCGRVFVMNDFCRRNNIKPPRVILTEHGFDHLNDLEAWYQTLHRTSQFGDIRGWKTLVEQWRVFFPQWSEGRTLFETLAYMDSELYKGSNVEAQLIFCWGYIDKQWETFDVATNTVFHSFLKDYVRGLLMATPVTPNVPRPTPAGAAYKGTITTSSNVRIGNGTSYAVLYKTNVGDEVLYYPDSIVLDGMNKYQWIWVEPTDIRKSAGWVALVQPVSQLFIPIDVLPPPPVEESPNVPSEPDFSTYTGDQKAAAIAALSYLSDVSLYIISKLRKAN